MTAPNQPIPNGSIQLGQFAALQAATPEDTQAALTQGARVSYGGVQDGIGSQIRDPLDNVHLIAVAAQGSADQAVTEAQAAANSAAVSEATAAALYQAATYWEVEFVAASAAVVLGVNELLIGPVQNVPVGLIRKVTDIHVAFLTQPNGITFELKKWDPDGLVDSVIETYTLTANQTRANWQIGLDGYQVVNRERLFVNVTSVTGTVAPVVLQVLLFGVLYDPELQPED